MGNQLAWMASNPIGVGITGAKTTGISVAKNSIAGAAAVKALSGNLRYFQHSTQSLVEFSTQLLTLFSPSYCHCPFDSHFHFHFQFFSSCHCLGLRNTYFFFVLSSIRHRNRHRLSLSQLQQFPDC